MAEQQINVAQQDTLEAIDNKIDTLDAVADNIYAKVDTEVAAINAGLEEVKKSVSDGKSAIATAITNKGVTTASDAEFATMASNINSITTINDVTNKGATTYQPKTTAQTISAGTYCSGAQTIAATTGTAKAADVLSGKTFNSANGIGLTGTMANQGAKTASLNCGGSYTIPAGYHNGSGKVTANSLKSQTSATATKADILSGKTAWVNGSKITGTADMVTNGYITIDSGNTIITYNSYIGDFLVFDLIGTNIDGTGVRTYMSRWLIDNNGSTFTWDSRSSTSTRVPWSQSNVRAILNGSFYNGFPSGLKSQIKAISKISYTDESAGTTETTTDYCWHLSNDEYNNNTYGLSSYAKIVRIDIQNRTSDIARGSSSQYYLSSAGVGFATRCLSFASHCKSQVYWSPYDKKMTISNSCNGGKAYLLPCFCI